MPCGLQEVGGGCSFHCTLHLWLQWRRDMQAGPQMLLLLVVFVPAFICGTNNKALECCFCARTQVADHFVSD